MGSVAQNGKGTTVERHERAWNPASEAERLQPLLQAVAAMEPFTPTRLRRLLSRHRRSDGQPFSKDQLVAGYKWLCERGDLPPNPELLRRLRMKPVRTLSGVAPVAVMTKPFPCPGECIFCPEDVRMPKSYLPDEPGAMRAERYRFDPYEQTAGRIEALERIGHTVDKVELLILGGTWSYYPPDYQEWFIRRCLEAMNGTEARSLVEAQRANETAPHRNVGLVVETRPDYITSEEVQRLRYLGVTKVQLGVQSLDDRILALNRRGHTVEDVRRAMALLRAAGFKVAVHWMPNLLGATPESDLEDFRRLWSDPALRPDELKIYPTALLDNTALYDYWRRGEYEPYSTETLVELLIACKQTIPPYCRVNRVIRDIPAGHIVAGNTLSNLREIVQREMGKRGLRCRCIRCREVRGQPVEPERLRRREITYETTVSREHFLSYETPEGKLVGFLRLSLPDPAAQAATGLEEIVGSAMIREVHVYGPALAIGAERSDEAQHAGLGGRLIAWAREIAHRAGYRRLAVIAAVGTRGYYRRHGFVLGETYVLGPSVLGP